MRKERDNFFAPDSPMGTEYKLLVYVTDGAVIDGVQFTMHHSSIAMLSWQRNVLSPVHISGMCSADSETKRK